MIAGPLYIEYRVTNEEAMNFLHSPSRSGRSL